jgi:inosine-uridine nucleoside N-ribohydrolase
MEPLILDVDTGEDDALAILLAITDGMPLSTVITSYGRTTVENATYNTASVVELASADVEVWMGASGPLSAHPHLKHGELESKSESPCATSNGLSGVRLNPPERVTIRRFADGHETEEIVRRLFERGPVHYCVTGPCTNLARLCQLLGSKAKEVISRVTLAGGTFPTHTTSGPPETDIKQRTEFNVSCDPLAADIVIRSGLPISIVSRDATRHLVIPKARGRSLKATGPCAEFARTLMHHFFNSHESAHEQGFNLNAAAALWLTERDRGAFAPRSVSVDLNPHAFGATRLDATGTPVNLYMLSAQRSNQIIYEILQKLSLHDPI